MGWDVWGNTGGKVSGWLGDAFGGADIDFEPTAYEFDKNLGVVGGANTEKFDTLAQNVYSREAPGMTAAAMEASRIAQLEARDPGFRNRQMGLADSLQRRIDGGAPSPAEMQMRRGLANAVSNARSQAAGATSANRALARKGAMAAAADLGQKAIVDTAMLRAKEGIAAENSLGNVLGVGRQSDTLDYGQDIDLVTNQAKLDQEAAKVSAGFKQEASIENLATEAKYTKMNDDMVQFFMNEGFSRDEAESRARIKVAEMKARDHARVEGTTYDIAVGNQATDAANNQLLPAALATAYAEAQGAGEKGATGGMAP